MRMRQVNVAVGLQKGETQRRHNDCSEESDDGFQRKKKRRDDTQGLRGGLVWCRRRGGNQSTIEAAEGE